MSAETLQDSTRRIENQLRGAGIIPAEQYHISQTQLERYLYAETHPGKSSAWCKNGDVRTQGYYTEKIKLTVTSLDETHLQLSATTITRGGVEPVVLAQTTLTSHDFTPGSFIVERWSVLPAETGIVCLCERYYGGNACAPLVEQVNGDYYPQALSLAREAFDTLDRL